MKYFLILILFVSLSYPQKTKQSTKKITEAELIGILEKNLEDKNYNQLLSHTLLLNKNYPNSVAIPYFLGMYYYNTKTQLDSAEYFLKLSVGKKYQMFNSLYALTLLAFNDLKDYNKAYEYAGDASNIKTLFGDTNTIKRSEVCFIAGYLSEYYYKNYNNAKLWYYSAYKDNPNNTYAIYNLALLNYKTKNFDISDEYFKILLTKNHNLSRKQLQDVYEILCYIAQKKDNYSDLLKYAQLGYPLAPNIFVFYYGHYYNYKKDYYSFINKFKEVYNNYPEAEIAFQVAYGYMKLGDNNQTVDWLKIAARKGHQEAQQRLRRNGISW